jgi:acid phosphatase
MNLGAGTTALALALGVAAGAWAFRPDHVVLVIEENHAFDQIIGSKDCPYLNQLAQGGVLLTRAYAITHPSEPNYLALFAGSTFQVADDACPPPGSPYADACLGSQLLDAGRGFVGYAESLPGPGAMDCSDTARSGYRRKHNPWVDFSRLPASTDQPFSAFPSDFTRLPGLALVVPNMENDMHDGTPAEADAWLKDKLGAYVQWCAAHNSLLVVTWDEDNGAEGNHIPALFYGAGLRPGTCGQRTDHYGMLRTLCWLFGVQPMGGAAKAKALTGIFTGPGR